MRQRPGPDELERLATAILRDHPLPDDPQDRSYEQRMALKALSIAEFDRKRGTADIEEEIALFTTLYGKEAVKSSGHDDAARIKSLNLVLVDQIRAGVWDEATTALKALLTTQVRARLTRTNPKYMKARVPDD